MSSDRSAFMAFLVGGVIGAGIALLYAPQSGAETRRKIRNGAEDAQDWAKNTFEGARGKVVEGSEKVRHMISEKKEDIKAAVEAGKDAYYREKDRLKEVL
jgi:gas vesicle protein